MVKIDTMVVLREYDNLIQAELAKSILDGAGIWSMINNEYMSTIYPTGVMPAQLIVYSSDLSKAKNHILRVMEEVEQKEEFEASMV